MQIRQVRSRRVVVLVVVREAHKGDGEQRKEGTKASWEGESIRGESEGGRRPVKEDVMLKGVLEG